MEEENKKNKNQVGKKWTAIVVILVLVVSVVFIYFNNKGAPNVDERNAKFIGNNSVLYTQLGCSHCISQEKVFGDNYKYLNVIDCFYDMDKCIVANISVTPTWIINGKYYEGKKTIEELKNLINEK